MIKESNRNSCILFDKQWRVETMKYDEIHFVTVHFNSRLHFE